MKNVNINELSIPAYALVETTIKKAILLVGNRDEGRSYLKEYKKLNPENKFKLVKLAASKFVR